MYVHDEIGSLLIWRFKSGAVVHDMPNIFGSVILSRISNQLSEYLSHHYNLSIGLNMNLVATKTLYRRQNLATFSILLLLIARTCFEMYIWYELGAPIFHRKSMTHRIWWGLPRRQTRVVSILLFLFAFILPCDLSSMKSVRCFELIIQLYLSQALLRILHPFPITRKMVCVSYRRLQDLPRHAKIDI